jgi:hypothetical protein
MARPTFRAYMENVEALTGKTAEDLWQAAIKKGYVKQGKIVAKHGELLTWLKSKELGLGHVRANFVVLYLRLRTDDTKLTAQSREWAYATGYKEYAK